MSSSDSFGDLSCSANASINVYGDLMICNGGKVPITMSFASPVIPSFTLAHINYYDEFNDYIGSTCECKSVPIPQDGTQVAIHVDGGGLPDWLNPDGIIPYDGYISAQFGIQYFTVQASVQDNLLYYVMYKGEAYGAECNDYVYK